jgi:DNA mismatch repair protein MutS2
VQKTLQSEEARVRQTKLKKGDIVWIRSLRDEGELLEDADDKEKLRVLIGNAKITLDRNDLEKLDKPEADNKVQTSLKKGKIDIIDKGLKPELDLRGLDSVEAIEKTNVYLSEVVDAGWDEVRIVHGKGTGVLRKKINEYLSRDRRVLEKRIGRFGEGDTGVTVVKLRK